MSDVEDDWKPNGRPMSTLALNFANSLDNVFELNTEIETLSRSIARKRQSVSIQKSELEKLQARIRETEERLKESQGSASLAPAPGQLCARIPARRPPGLDTVPHAESEEDEGEEDSSESSESSDSELAEDRPSLNKPLRNSQSTAQTSPSEASDSNTEEDEEEEEEEEEEEKRSAVKKPPPRKQSLSQNSPIQTGKRSAVKQVQRKTLASRGKA